MHTLQTSIRRNFTLLLLAICCVTAVAQRKWVVSDETLTVWGTPDYLNKLGMLHRGDTIVEEGIENEKIRFTYQGKKGYVATYCCKRVTEETVKKSTKEKGPSTPEQQATPTNEQEQPTEASPQSGEKGNTLTGIVMLLIFCSYIVYVFHAMKSAAAQHCMFDSTGVTAGFFNRKFIVIILAGLFSAFCGLLSVATLIGSGKEGFSLSMGFGILSCIVMGIASIVLPALYIFKYMHPIFMNMIYTRQMHNWNISLIFYVTYGYSLFMLATLLNALLPILSYIIALIYFVRSIQKYRSKLDFRCPRCHCPNSSYDRQKDGIRRAHDYEHHTHTDVSSTSNSVTETTTTTHTRTTDYYQMYQETHVCAECGYTWHRRTTGEHLGSDSSTKKEIEKETVSW